MRATQQHAAFAFQKSPFLAAYLSLTPSARRFVEGASEPARSSESGVDPAESSTDDDEQSHTNSDDESAAATATTRQRRTGTLSESGSLSGSPSLKQRSGSISVSPATTTTSSPSKRGLGGLVRSLTRSQRTPTKKSDESSSSPATPLSASTASTQSSSPQHGGDGAPPARPTALGESLTRTRSSSMGKSTRKTAHPAGVSTLRTASRHEDERGSSGGGEDDDGSDSDSGGGHGDAAAEAADALNSPRLQSARRLVRARAAADAAAAASEQSSFVGALEATGSADSAATLRSVVLGALKSSAAARHMMLERLDTASGHKLQSQVRLFDAHDDEQLRSSERVREAFDAAIAQSTHLHAYIGTNRGSDSASSSPRSERASSPAPTTAAAAAAATTTASTATASSYFSFPGETAATRLASVERAGRLRSTSVESHSSQESSPRAHVPLDRAKLSSLGPSFSLLSHSSASAASSASPRVMSRRVSALHVAPDLETTLIAALGHLYPARHLRVVSLDDKSGRVYGWPTTVQLYVLDDEKGDEPPLLSLSGDTGAKYGSVPMVINAFRATADGVAADDSDAGRAIPFSIGTAFDAAELAVFVRAAQLHRAGSQVAKSTRSHEVIGALAVRLIDDALALRASEFGIRVIVF
jgi:hypothetical protein